MLKQNSGILVIIPEELLSSLVRDLNLLRLFFFCFEIAVYFTSVGSVASGLPRWLRW